MTDPKSEPSDEIEDRARAVFEAMSFIADDEKCIALLVAALTPAPAQPEPPTAAGALTDDQCDAAFKQIHNWAVQFGPMYGLPLADVAAPAAFRALIRAAAAGGAT